MSAGGRGTDQVSGKGAAARTEGSGGMGVFSLGNADI